jgi:hypothetical protein
MYLLVQMLPALASAATLEYKSGRNSDNILLSHLRPGSLFCHLLRLAGLRWRHSNPPPRDSPPTVPPVQSQWRTKHLSTL